MSSSAAHVASKLSHVVLDSQVSPISPISAGNLPHVITLDSRSSFSDNNSPKVSSAKGVANTRKAGLHTFALGASDRLKLSVE